MSEDLALGIPISIFLNVVIGTVYSAVTDFSKTQVPIHLQCHQQPDMNSTACTVATARYEQCMPVVHEQCVPVGTEQ